MNTIVVTTVDITSSVLIDTWWNVNKLRDTPVLADRIVLIDTWWNVNYDVYEIEELATGFNRYMVECEFICCQIKRTAEIVLIDTWWNVNHKERSIEVSQVEVLIDTWWNVNRI